jgi:hypothetical protein
MSFPSFATGEVLTAADMNAVGLWLVKTQTIGTGVTSIVVNDAFSSEYQTYRIIIENESTSGGASHLMQLNGITGSNYFSGGTYGSWGGATQTGFGNAATTTWTLSANAVAGTGTSIIMDVTNPNIARRKYAFNTAQAGNGHLTFNHYCTSTSTATGFTITKAGETMTGGIIRVYGYRN